MTSAISVDGLVRRFDGVTAVDHVDLDVLRGEIYGFLGPNGAGKSTTVRVLCTLLTPTEGRAVVAGYDVATQPDKVRLRIGVALQEAALDPKQTGIELLRLQGRLYGLTRTEIDAPSRGLAQLIDIGDCPDSADRHVFGRHEAPARSGRGAGARAARCCSWTSRRRASIR